MNNCGLANDTVQAGEWIHYVSKTLVLPSYLVIGTVCNALLLIAFYKQSKIEKPYIYQVLLTTSKTLEVIVFGSYLMGQDWWSGMVIKGAEWFQKSYVIMFINFKLGTVLHIHFIISSVLLSTAMAADRVFCLTWPMRYKNINHSRHQLTAGLICFTLPAIASISYAWFWEIRSEGDQYSIVMNTAFTDSTVGQLCSKAGVGLRLIGLTALVVINVISVRAFSKRSKKLTKLGQKKMASESKSAEKALFVLSVSQSVLMCVNQIPHVTLHVLLYAAPCLTTWLGMIMSPVADTFIFLTDMLDIVVVLAVNKSIRSMVKRAIGLGSNQVGPAAPATGNVNNPQGAHRTKNGITVVQE